MAKFYLGKLNLTALEGLKSKAYQGKNLSLDVAIWVNDEPDQYGNTISISSGKGEDKVYVGNAKEYQKSDAPF